VPRVQRLKILIHGQEVETLAGHLDLTGTFLVNTKGVQVAPAVAPVTAPAPGADKPAAPATDKPASPTTAPATKPGSSAGEGTLTPDKGSGEPVQSERNP
jgi:hypothetical protein